MLIEEPQPMTVDNWRARKEKKLTTLDLEAEAHSAEYAKHILASNTRRQQEEHALLQLEARICGSLVSLQLFDANQESNNLPANMQDPSFRLKSLPANRKQ